MKARDWRAVISSTHPWCNCQLHFVSDGSDFVKRKTIKEPFESGSKKYKRGSLISDEEYSKLNADEKENISESAILEFTGKTASLDIKKSMNDLFVLDDDEPICHVC